MGLASVNVMGQTPTYYTKYVSAAYEASKLIAAKPPQRVLMVKGYNSGAAQFVQLHDASAAPADGVAPMAMQAVAATDNFYFVIPVGGLPPTVNGLYICNSSTGPTKTLGAANCWFEVYYC